MTVNKQTKLEVLAEAEGMSVEEMIEQAAVDVQAPCICMNPYCDHTDTMEPDQDAGWCDECETPTMSSCLVIGGYI